MASSKDYLQFILEQLSDLEEITYRAMMGEYILYYRGKIVGGIYDDRLLFIIFSCHNSCKLFDTETSHKHFTFTQE